MPQTTDHVRLCKPVCSALDTIECFLINGVNGKCCSVEEIIQRICTCCMICVIISALVKSLLVSAGWGVAFVCRAMDPDGAAKKFRSEDGECASPKDADGAWAESPAKKWREEDGESARVCVARCRGS